MTFLACLFLSIGLAMAQTRVTGTVTSSEDGEPIMGATVKVVGNNAVGTITDIDGNFSLELKNANAELEFSYIGMTTKKVKASAKMTVILDANSHMLENVIITGYGSAKKLGSVVGAVSTVSGEKMKTVATPNFTDALAGQVSGLSVLSSAGDPSMAASIRLRGVNSMNSSNEPLFILDGAPITSSFFQTLNPSDIANITVLKDAASTAIYGSRAANGVIVITSRNGKYNESAQVIVKAQYGISTPTSDGVTMMNSQQYVEFLDKIGVPLSEQARKAAQHISTNWRDEMLSNSAPTSDINATMQGGGNSVNYYLSFNHHEQEGLIQSSGMQRNTLAARINARLNRFFKVGFSSNFGNQRYKVNREWNASGIYSANPLVFARQALPYDAPYYYHYDENGNIVKDGKADGLLYSGKTGLVTPEFYDKHRKQDVEQVTLNIGLNEVLTPMEGLTFTAQQSLYGYDTTQEMGNIPYDAFVTPMGQTIRKQDGSLADGFSRYYAYTLTHTGEWKKNFGDHYVNVLVGEETRIQRSRSFSVTTSGQTDDRLMLLTSGTKANPGDMGDSRSEAVANSIFGNAEYNFKEKYFVYGSLRRDGSSKFAPDHRWGTFWSAGGKWNAKKESFLAPVKWLDNLTLSVNYGTTGNDSGAGTYGYFGLFGDGGMYNGNKSIGIAQPSNYQLTWETVSKLNVGLNVSLFRRLDLDFNFYRNKTSDMLMNIPYSYTTGFGSGSGNIGAMTNTGFEINANVQIIATKDINWTFSANVGYNKNEITELFQGRDEYTIANTGLKLKVGHAYGEFYSVRNAGVDPRTGEPQWYDKDGNITKIYNEERDAVFTGKNRYAPWIGGFGTNFTWKGLSVIADFAWAADKWMMQNDDYFIKNAKWAGTWNQRVEMLNIWTTPGQVTDIPAYGYEIQLDDHLIQNASFLRMKTLTVQYDLPKKWLAPTRYIKGVKVFGIARNLFTITSFEGYDPEPDINIVQFNYPNTRQFMIGAELTF